MSDLQELLRVNLRQVADFPKPGINFIDITTLLQSPQLFQRVIDDFSQRYSNAGLGAVVAVEARGFILGSAIALALGLPFVPVRKPGKLPSEVEQISYSLEYGEDSLEIHKDAFNSGTNVLIVDDLIATGGTLAAVIELLQRLGASVHECACIIELSFLNPRAALGEIPVYSQIQYHSE